MSQTNSSLMSIITQYTKQFVDRISELENENKQLKQQVGSVPSNLKADFDRLSERHAELKSAYMEIERENAQLRLDMDQLTAQQKSLESEISQYFTKAFSKIQPHPDNARSPTKTVTVQMPQVVPSQKPLHREAKATTKLLNTAYESDSELDSSDSDSEYRESVSRKLRFADEPTKQSKQTENLEKSFSGLNSSMYSPGQQTGSSSNTLNLSSILPNQEDEESDDDYESILKHIITEGLMSGLEHMNKSPSSNKPQKSNESQKPLEKPTLNPNMFGSRYLNQPQLSQSSKLKQPSTQPSPNVHANTQRPGNQGQPPNPNVQPNPFATMFNYLANPNGNFVHGPHTAQTRPQSATGAKESVPGPNRSFGANPNPSVEEVEMVQKILESLFNPPTK